MTLAPRNRWLVLTAVILAFLPVVVDMTILHIAVPSLTVALGASGTEILWIIDIYPLIMAGLLVPMGTLGDRVAQGSWKIGHALLLIAGLIATVYAVKSGFKAGPSVWVLGVLALGLGLMAWFARLQIVAAEPLLDLSLFRKPAISVGMLMAFVASGSFAGFELLLAQELQYVYGRTPLQAGLFMMPLVVASAIAGPIAGKLAGRFGLRWLGTVGLAAASLALFGISQSNIGGDGVVIGGLMAVLGFALGVGLLASSAAIMGAAPVEKAGAAGSLEATGYELGAGLGITFFGVLLSTIYRGNFVAAAVPGIDADAASGSIGEAMVLAGRIGGAEGEAIAAAARVAFASAHGSVLVVTSSLIAVLAAVVFVALRHEAAPAGARAALAEH